MANFGPEPEKKHGYPGHPEIELAILRLYRVTQNPKHLEFAHYLLSERGVTRDDLGGTRYFMWEAKERGDEGVPETMDSIEDTAWVWSQPSDSLGLLIEVVLQGNLEKRDWSWL